MPLSITPVAFWRLDEINATDATAQYADATGRGNTLTPGQIPAAEAILDFRLGANAAGGQTLTGRLSQWGKWDRLLTTAEKAALYGAGTPEVPTAGTWATPTGGFPTTPSLNDAKAFYLLDEAANATTYADATGRGNTLTRTGTTTQNAGPGGVGNAVGLAGSSWLGRAITADLVAGNYDTTVAGWAYLTGLGSNNTQQVFWAQVDITGTPRTGYGHYLVTVTSPASTLNYDYGCGFDTDGNAVITNTALNPVLTGTWYWVLAEYEASKRTIRHTINNANQSAFNLAVQPTPVPAPRQRGHKFARSAIWVEGVSNGYDSGAYGRLVATLNNDVKFGNNPKTGWFWFKAPDISTAQTLMGIIDVSVNKIDWGIQISGGSLYFILGNGVTSFSFCSAVIPNATDWHLAVFWFDKNGDGKVHLNIDNGAVVATPATMVTTPATPASVPFTIGCATNGTGRNGSQYTGSLSGIGIADGVPTGTDIPQLWAAGLGYNYTGQERSPTQLANYQRPYAAGGMSVGSIG